MSFKTYALAAVLSLSPAALLADAADLMVMDPYVRSSTPSSKTGAIFFELMNRGEEDRLIGASTPVAGMAQLHTHEEDANGVMRMIHVEEGFDIPAGGTVMFKRGGNHVMLMGLTGPLKDGTTVPLTLIFEKAGEVVVEVPVDQTRKPAAHGGGHGHGSGAANDS